MNGVEDCGDVPAERCASLPSLMLGGRSCIGRVGGARFTQQSASSRSMRWFTGVLLGVVLCSGATAQTRSTSDTASRGSPTISVVDDAGRTVTLSKVPQRIVSIAPGATEMLFAAGAGSCVIATVEFSDEPAEAKAIPRIGDSNAIDMERVVSLRPDVVVVWEGGSNLGQVSQLEHMRVPLYRQKVERLGDIPMSLRRLGMLAGTQSVADAAARDIEARLTRLEHQYSRDVRPTVLLEVWNRPIYTVGGTHMMADSLRLCGARNVFEDLKDKGPSVDTEAVIGRDPEIIVAVAPTGMAAEWLAEWKRFGTMRAVRDERLVPFEDARLSRLGPSAVGGTEALCKALHAKPN